MRESAALARAYGLQMHTHLAETDADVAYSVERFGMRPGDYAEDMGWIGDDVWHAHCVKLNTDEIALFGRSRHWRLPLPVVEYAPGLGHRADSKYAR